MDYTSTGGMRSPFSPRVRQSISGRRALGLSSQKKTQSYSKYDSQQQTGDVIYKTTNSTLETYGMPLPVMVTEALTFGSGDLSVHMSPCGWCWIVTGRRVLAWPREITGSSGPTSARELTLPQTDLAHKADLVAVFYENNEQTMPSCVGVSPEGVVRYWASVGQEGAYSEVSCELAGQECDRLVTRVYCPEVTVGSLLLATTTCTLIRITTSKEGRPSVSCQTLRPPSGWLGGIGRRVSLLFFGSMPAHADTKLVGVVILPAVVPTDPEEESSELVCLLAGGPLLQMWCGSALHEHHLRRLLLEAAARAHLAPHGEPSTMEVVALDVQPAGDRLLLLLVMVSAINQARPNDVRYALAQISVEKAEAPRVVSLCPVGGRARDDVPPRCLPLGTRALLYTPAAIAIVSATPSSQNEKAECVEVCTEGDRVLGAAAVDGGPAALVFTRRHGLLALRIAHVDHSDAHQSFAGSPMGSPAPSDVYDGNLTLYEIDPHEIGATTTDACGKMKAAFLFHIRRDATAGKILAELFPVRGGGAPGSDVDAPLDRTTIAIATEMLDDVPAGDPRWRIATGASRVALGSSGALHAAGQLRDKHRAFTLFLDFLRANQLWRRLALVSKESGTGCVRTVRALCSLAEKLSAARAVQRLHHNGALLLDAAMHQVASRYEAEEEPEVVSAMSSGALSAADVVLRRVTRMLRVVRALATLPAPALDAQAAAAHAHSALVAITSILSEMLKVRTQWSSWSESETECEPFPELPVLVKYHTTAVTESAHNCRDAALRAQVLEASAALADLLLTDALSLPEHRFRTVRRELIYPYVSEGQTERAAALAEKFKDFELIVEMCTQRERPDPEKLYSYIDKYEHEGIAETTFAWLASRSGADRAELLRGLGARRPARLARWLANAPDRRELLALHQLATPPLHQAADTLLSMADDERESVNRMVTMASLAKLCLIASEEPAADHSDKIQRADDAVNLGAQHHALPRDVKRHYDLDQEDMRRSDPEELVQMYIDCDTPTLNEYDYKKALDLTDFVDDPELRDDLKLKIWCACIAREEWRHVSVDEPQSAVQGTVFYRLLELLTIMGADVESLLPPLEQILEQPTLKHIVSDPRLHYLLKYTYASLADDNRDTDMDT
ncbi:unnamed protein product [Leptosia nina]|uniref:Nucleoporin Nup133/Nup155-like N-terminal domain-containing protein n=1 Tax=Leptosia nina TaxID=320188 RepID=A0AAV1JV52_9NEOP